MIKLNIYFEDLREETKEEIIQMLKEDKEIIDEVEESIESGIDKETAENEIIDNYINTHNNAIEYTL